MNSLKKLKISVCALALGAQIFGGTVALAADETILTTSQEQMSKVTGPGRENPYLIDSSFGISGNIHPGVEMISLYIDDQLIEKRYQNSSFFLFPIDKGVINENSKVEIEELTLDGSTRYPVDVVAHAKSVETSNFVANDYTVGQSSITGTCDTNASLVVLSVDEQIQGSNAVNSENNTFEINLSGSENITKNSKVELIQYSTDGQKLYTTVNVLEGESPELAEMIINDYKLGTNLITGTFSGNLTKAEVYVNGERISTGGTFKSDGTFDYYVASGKIKQGDKITINGLTKFNEKLIDQQVIAIASSQTQGSITEAKYKLGENEIKGTYTGDVSRAEVYVNGGRISTGGTFNVDGTFNYYVAGGIIKQNDVVTINAYDANGNLLEEGTTVPVIVKNTEGSITEANFKLGENQIKGIFTGDVSRAEVYVNGDKISTGGTFNADGTFNYYVAGGKIKQNDVVTINAYDMDGKLLEENKNVVVL